MDKELKNILIAKYIEHTFDWSSANIQEYIKYSKSVNSQFTRADYRSEYPLKNNSDEK